MPKTQSWPVIHAYIIVIRPATTGSITFRSLIASPARYVMVPPFADMPTPFAMLAAALRRRERHLGDRVMAKVLATVPAHGLEAVLVAVELVLESGMHSAEHVLNVLARLNQEGMPAQVETSLMLTEEPLADTARYDSLNAKEVTHV